MHGYLFFQYASQEIITIKFRAYRGLFCDQDTFFAKGGEAMVYLDSDRRDVIKQNDAIYYANWLEFFNSLVLHNLFFPNTAFVPRN